MFLDNKNVKVSSVTITDNAPFFQTKALSGRVTKRMAGPQFFTVKFTATWMKEHLPQVKKFIALHKFGQPFEMPLGYFSEYKGNAINVTVSAKSNKGSRLVKLGQFSGTLEAGTYIRFKNHAKIYQVTEDVQANGTMKIFPSLYQEVNAGESVNFNNITASFILTNDSYDIPISSVGKLDFTATENV
ncbi:hypothetical protein [Serratia quinivorans]|uniref:hypothetical protein n=1 Tax=Serratia quinivorans TaxID=137545 RepID=UPI00217B586E|nr:hypothetical protein [Serratia quinivorans]CAI0912277.1 Uncharacterised protein [Serratia quinivorans]CAI2096288.1 Uncharacterised protein [Serratia quinivorans]